MAQGTTKGVPIDTDGTLSNNSDLLVPSQKAVKTYAQPQLNGTGFVKATGTIINYDNTTYYPQPAGTTTQYIRGDGSLATFPLTYLNSSAVVVTGTTAQTIAQSILIPANTFVTGDVIEIAWRLTKTTSTATVGSRLNVNTSLSMTGALQITTQSLVTTTLFAQLNRTANIISSTNTSVFSNSTASSSDVVINANAATSLNIDWTVNQYIFTMIQPTNIADITTSAFLSIKRLRP